MTALMALLLAAKLTTPPELAYSTSTATTLDTGAACTDDACRQACQSDGECSSTPWCINMWHCTTDDSCICQHYWFPPYPGAGAKGGKKTMAPIGSEDDPR